MYMYKYMYVNYCSSKYVDTASKNLILDEESVFYSMCMLFLSEVCSVSLFYLQPLFNHYIKFVWHCRYSHILWQYGQISWEVERNI